MNSKNRTIQKENMQNTINQVAEQANVAPSPDTKSVADVIQFSSISPETLLIPMDKEGLINAFYKAMDSISEAGVDSRNEDNAFQEKSRIRVINGLGKILGIYIKFFKNASAENNELLFNKLRDKFGLKSNSSTTVFHLLSRLYRGDNTRQASGDAKVLSLAFAAGKDESSFAAWVKANEGLDKIKKGSADREKTLVEEREVTPPMPRTVGGQKVLFKKAEDAVWRLAKAKQTEKVFSIDQDAAPLMFAKLRPHEGKNWRVMVMEVVDDELRFHGLYSQRMNPHQDLAKVVNVDGTSDSDWPEWMLGKPDDVETSKSAADNTEKAAV
jgi:hypothetical protein